MHIPFKQHANLIAFLTIIFVLIGRGLLAQTEYLVGHIGLKDGLSSQLCSHILEDDKGNLWISTYQDVQKYDGYSVTVFSQPFQGEKSKPITDLLKDARGNIWVVQGESVFNIDPFNMNSFYVNGSVHIIDAITDSIYSLQDYLGTHQYGKLDIVKVFSIGNALFLCTSDNRIFKYEKSLELHATPKDIKKVVTISETGDIIYMASDGLSVLRRNNNSELLLPSNNFKKFDGLITSQKGELFFIAEKADSASIYEYTNSQLHFVSTFEIGLFRHTASRPNKIEYFGKNKILVWNRLFELQEGGKTKEIKLARTQRLISEYIVSSSGLGYAATDLGVFILNTDRNRFEKLASNNDSLNSMRAFYSDRDINLYREGVEKIAGHSTKYDLGFLDNYDLGYLAYHHYRDPVNRIIFGQLDYWMIAL